MPPSVRFVMGMMVVAGVSVPVSYALFQRGTIAGIRTTAEATTGGRVDAGRATFKRFGCGSCHGLFAVPGAAGLAGPPLDAFGRRTTVAGVLPNEPKSLIRWLRDPQGVVPGNAMPDQGIGDTEARDLAAYLYTLR